MSRGEQRSGGRTPRLRVDTQHLSCANVARWACVSPVMGCWEHSLWAWHTEKVSRP